MARSFVEILRAIATLDNETLRPLGISINNCWSKIYRAIATTLADDTVKPCEIGWPWYNMNTGKLPYSGHMINKYTHLNQLIKH